MKDNFLVMIETWHKPDLGEQDNVSKQSTLLINVQNYFNSTSPQ